MKLNEVSGGGAAADVGEILQMLHDQEVDPQVIALYEQLCMKLIKCGADVTIIDDEIEFAMPFFNISVGLNIHASGFRHIYLMDVEDIVYDLFLFPNAQIDRVHIEQAALVDWDYFTKALHAASQLRNYMSKAFVK
jgi:hypothetical protein